MSANKQQDSHKPPSDGSVAKEEFIRVGTSLYKIVEQPRLNGGYVKKRIAWNNETLRQDYGKDYIGSVPKYDGFCTVPEHIGYRPVVGKFLNLYEPIDHRPKEGDFSHIQSLIRHIFGEQYELGMDYLQLLYQQPIQKLPILLLVSEERNTGKSTFLNFLKALFQNNVTFNTNEDFRSQFNSDWAGKLLIVVDEVLLNRREDSERLKNLSTTLSYKVEAKGKDRDEIAFFAKFVLCSNNEYLPVIIDAGETRYWVRKIERLQSDDTDFLQKLKAEIPAFLHFLQHRQLSSEKESRMWFAPSLLHTEALQKIIRSNRNRLEIEMQELILDIMDSVGTDTFSFCYNDLLLLLVHSQVKVEKHQVRKVLQECWKLTPAPNTLTYNTYQVDYTRECRYSPIRRIGRFYTVTREQLTTL
ncbi:helicase [Phocaeicola dorei]|uniref:primase-helicase family protein n=1 Tax=Phocaeicola dorei TaxID=357276 RepID=UPI001C38485A|nr:primase-helicase family protein [Phocaeicola dorei]MBV3581415.1 helicase [Phocaeicola dorei]MBV3606811.1 helicase [Phocaeicola dorei]